jgi:hypothetical protein
LRPLPFPGADRLVTLGDLVSGYGWTSPGFVTAPEVVAYARDARSFQSLGGYAYVLLSELSGVVFQSYLAYFRIFSETSERRVP